MVSDLSGVKPHPPFEGQNFAHVNDPAGYAGYYFFFISSVYLLVIHGHLNCNVLFCFFQQYSLFRTQLLEHILRCTRATPPLLHAVMQMLTVQGIR